MLSVLTVWIAAPPKTRTNRSGTTWRAHLRNPVGVLTAGSTNLAWLTAGVLLGLLIPVLGVAVIAAFNVFYWLPIRGESPRAPS